MTKKLLYAPLSKKEAVAGGCFAAAYLSVYWGLFMLGSAFALLLGIWALTGTLLCILVFRRFWKETIANLPYVKKGLIWKPLTAALFAKVVCVFCNDIFMFYGFPYFVPSDWGPALWDIRGAVVAQLSASPILPGIVLLLLLPLTEEFCFRGVIFGSLYPKAPIIAALLSVFLFAFFRTALFAGMIGDNTYLLLYFLQHIPLGLLACWLYTAADTIAAPVLLHLISNLLFLTSVY